MNKRFVIVSGLTAALVCTAMVKDARADWREQQMDAYRAYVAGAPAGKAAAETIPPAPAATQTAASTVQTTVQTPETTSVTQETTTTITTPDAARTPLTTTLTRSDSTMPISAYVAPGTEPTVTTEKTTTTDYTVSKRKVGLVGNRPYAPVTQNVPGGATLERTVNGVEVAKEVITPDPVAGLKTQNAEGDYYSNKPEAKVYEKTDTNVRVINTGSFNH